MSADGKREEANVEGLLQALERGIEQFRIEAEKYFNGGLKLPPEDLRAHVHRLARVLQDKNIRPGEQFRLATLTARWNSLSELYGRRLREREEGRTREVRKEPVPSTRPALDPYEGIRLDPRLSGEGVETLFRELVQRGQSRIDLETFRQHLARQLEVLREKTGSERVIARLAEENGKWKLKLKPQAP